MAIGLLDSEGNDLTLADGQTTEVLQFTEAEQQFVFEQIDAQPLPSLLRGFFGAGPSCAIRTVPNSWCF